MRGSVTLQLLYHFALIPTLYFPLEKQFIRKGVKEFYLQL